MKYPLRQIPNDRIFIDVHKRLGEDGCFKKAKVDAGAHRIRRTVANEEAILQIVENNPKTSTRTISTAVPNVNRESVRQVLKE